MNPKTTGLIRAPGRIKRLLPGMVSLEIQNWPTTTVRWPRPIVAIGDRVVVEGYPDPRFPGEAGNGLRVCFVEVPRGHSRQRIQIADLPPTPGRAVTQPTVEPPWVDVLVEHGLLDDARELDPRAWTSPQIALRSRWMPRQGIARGVLHYGWWWRNDTTDPLADLAALGCLPLTPLRYRLEPALSHDPIGQLELAAAMINRELSEWGIDRRIWIWDTAADWVMFLGRNANEIATLKGLGIGNDLTLRRPAG